MKSSICLLLVAVPAFGAVQCLTPEPVNGGLPIRFGFSESADRNHTRLWLTHDGTNLWAREVWSAHGTEVTLAPFTPWPGGTLHWTAHGMFITGVHFIAEGQIEIAPMRMTVSLQTPRNVDLRFSGVPVGFGSLTVWTAPAPCGPWRPAITCAESAQLLRIEMKPSTRNLFFRVSQP